ncbi:hypothetical protein B0H67DRAFT_647047 [Lasiosphaeris hirsuta]|uniref:Uncharacterized protein n=1 Tax=Lasiosphaeris hirsuta TaxID=260670 RepID=A0AA40A9D5_9PEZI|nr:hypothetical protein B0H67DRAFT_647047 [Lasiosphaeris hirsuta]
MASPDEKSNTHISELVDRRKYPNTSSGRQIYPDPPGHRPLPALPPTPSPPLVLPKSKFYSRPRPSSSARRWEPKCNHTNMTRIYYPGYRCEVCGRSGKFGWLYRCTMDRDPLIIAARDEGHEVAFDELGVFFSSKMSLGKCGPDVRLGKYSFLNEVTPEQLQSYSPAQLAIVLSQRDNVHTTISEERHRPGHPPHYAVTKYPDDSKPWVPDERLECQYKICHSCHHFGKEKSFLGLDGILDGYIPPHAATAFGFNPLGRRPVTRVDLVKNLGYRAVPMPKGHTSRRLANQISKSGSTSRIIEIIDGHLEAAQISSSDYSTSSDSTISDLSVDEAGDERGNLPRSPRLQLDEVSADHSCDDEEDVSATTPAGILPEEELVVRPPWTSPPTPIPKYEGVLALADEAKLLNIGPEVPTYNGRSPSSLKTNPAVRARVFSSIPAVDTASKVISRTATGQYTVLTRVPYQPEEMCDVGLFLPFSGEVFAKACSLPLPDATPEENLFLVFAAGSGVALTEEAVESGTVDIVVRP